MIKQSLVDGVFKHQNKGLSYSQIGNKLKISKSYVSKIINSCTSSTLGSFKNNVTNIKRSKTASSDEPLFSYKRICDLMEQALKGIEEHISVWDLLYIESCRKNNTTLMMKAQDEYQKAIHMKIKILSKIYDIMSKEAKNPISQAQGKTIIIRKPYYGEEHFAYDPAKEKN